ncbi:MAG TPA: hypothetical protein PLX56_04810 [bacterium]|nr:hypothetical protein [bacterium]HQO91634.1 hypothetical protein [bacterium]
MTFFKTKKIDHPALVLLNASIPFKRIMLFTLPVFLPLFSIVFGLEKGKMIEKILEDETFFEQLKNSLEKGLK